VLDNGCTTEKKFQDEKEQEKNTLQVKCTYTRKECCRWIRSPTPWRFLR